jgi:hypothetical protein
MPNTWYTGQYDERAISIADWYGTGVMHGQLTSPR